MCLAYKLLETGEVLMGSNLWGLVYYSITQSHACGYHVEQDTEIVELFSLF